MGIAKELLMHIEARGYGQTDKVVCSGCIGDAFLIKNYIHRYGEYGECSFCKDDNGKPIRHRKVYSLEKLMEVIMPAIRYYFMPAYGNIPFDNESDKYIGNVVDPYDFAYDYLAEELKTDNMDLIDEMIDLLDFEDRASVYEFQDRRSEKDLNAWNAFESFVINNKDKSAETIINECFDRNKPENYEEIRWTIQNVLNHARDMKAFRLINTGLPLYRCVNYLPKEKCVKGVVNIPAKSVGTAPSNFAANGRFNEKGDMMFYGASSASVAKSEIDKIEGNPYTIGIFYTNKRIKVIDLSAIAEWKRPSAFDLSPEAIERRESWFFLRQFIDIISKPIDDRNSSYAKTYYKPIQVFMKYIQHKSDLYGIVYRSTKSERNDKYSDYPLDLCYVLFAGHEDCYDACEWGTKLNKRKGLKLFMEKVWQE